MKKCNTASLIEVPVAIAILSFISLGVFQILDDTINTQDSVTKEDESFIFNQDLED